MLEFTETEEEMKDWKDSHYYQHIFNEHAKLLGKQGHNKSPPCTPRSQRDMSLKEKQDHNLK